MENNTNIPAMIPGKINPFDAISIEDKRNFIYSCLIMADTIDGYLLELESLTKKCGLYKQSFKGSLNEMKRNMEAYKTRMYKEICKDSFDELTSKLDLLDDNFSNDITILFHSINRYVYKFVKHTVHANCIACCSIIEILSTYSIMNEKRMSELINSFSTRNISIVDKNIQAISFQSRKYIGAFAQLYGSVDIDLNNCSEIELAFTIIDKKMARIHELLK